MAHIESTDTSEKYQGEIPQEHRQRTGIKNRIFSQLKTLRQSKLAMVGLFILLFYTGMALSAPAIAPHEPNERMYAEDGTWAESEPPSLDYPLGTTRSGHDVLSQLIWGSQIAMFVGYLGAILVAGIGTAVGAIAGYFGGRVDELIMRLVDVLYGLPFIPLVIVLASIFGQTVWNVILGIALIYWLSTARVIRSEVLSIKERPYIEAAQAVGASHSRILRVHVVPNVLSISALYGALAVGYAIVAQAGIAFLGFSDPHVPSWGVMLQRVFVDGSFDAWWWLLPPGLSITLVVSGAYFLGRGYDEVVNPQLQEP